MLYSAEKKGIYLVILPSAEYLANSKFVSLQAVLKRFDADCTGNLLAKVIRFKGCDSIRKGCRFFHF